MIWSFSFRYGENTGKRVWYKVEDDGKDICVRVEGQADEVFSHYVVVGADFLQELAEGIQASGIETWDGFYDIEQSLCSGDSWVLHVFYRDGREVHAMGHSARPDGFEIGTKMIGDIFGKVIK